MSDQEQPQHAVYAGVPTGQVPYSQTAYGQAGHTTAQTPYASAPKRPPLAPRHKRGAAWAGIVGFNLLTLGYSMFVIPIVVGFFGAFFGFVLRQLERSSRGMDSELRSINNFFTALDLGAWLIPGIIASVIGLVIMAVALLLSSVILKAHSVHRAWAVTWAGAGVAVVASWFVSWLPSLLAQLGFGVFGAADVGVWTKVAIAVGIYTLLGIIVNSVMGWLAWWWMAHALRARTPSVVTTGQE